MTSAMEPTVQVALVTTGGTIFVTLIGVVVAGAQAPHPAPAPAVAGTKTTLTLTRGASPFSVRWAHVCCCERVYE